MSASVDYSAIDAAILGGKLWEEYRAGCPDATHSKWRTRRTELRRQGHTVLDERLLRAARRQPEGLRPPDLPPAPGGVLTSDKRVGHVNWREWTDLAEQAQELAGQASWSQDFARVEIPGQQGPLLLVPFSDTHLGAWSANPGAFKAITDELLALGPERCRLLLLGDMAEMAIKLRSVAEVTGQMWTPEQQADVFESWLAEIEHLVVAATWDNHAVEREERGSGISLFRRMLNRLVVYHDGIGHLDLTVGKETYKLALSHRFGGYSIYNKTHGPNRYMKFEGSDREIAVQGDRHTPAKATYYDGNVKRLAITTGTLNTNSVYARRYFSLYSVPAYPVVEIWPDRHLFVDYWSLADWRAAKEAHVAGAGGAAAMSGAASAPAPAA